MAEEENFRIFEALSDENPEKRCEELAKCLSENLDSINSFDDTDNSPLMLACQNGYLDCISLLLKAGADVNEENGSGSTPLHSCFLEENVNSETRLLCIRLLLDHGANVHRACRYFVTPLMLACQVMDIECVKEILNRGYTFKKTSTQKLKPDNTNFWGGKVGASNRLKISPDYENDDINCIDHEAETALLHCLNSDKSEKRAECLKLLIAAGAQVNSVDDLSSRPLRYAIHGQSGSLDLVEILLEAGANLIDEDLICAIDVLNVDLIKLFLSKGISVETEDKFEDTPLLKLIADIEKVKELTDEKKKRIKECMKALIAANANINAFNTDHLQPIHSAVLLWFSFRFPAEFLISENCDLSQVTYDNLASVCGITIPEESCLLKILKFLYQCGLPSSQCPSFEDCDDEDDHDYQDIEACLREMLSSPRNLMDLCKFSVRRVLGLGIKRKCGTLDVPDIVKDIILLKNVLSDECFD